MEAAISCRARGDELSVVDEVHWGTFKDVRGKHSPCRRCMEIQSIIPQAMRVVTGTGSADYE